MEPTAPMPPRPRAQRDYARLKQLVKREGCLEKQIPYYVYKITLTLGLSAFAFAVPLVVDDLAIQLGAAGLLALAYGQLGLLAHDAAHNQISRSARVNRVLALLHFNLLTGISLSWWLDKHNPHHAYPNQVARDPDIDFPVLAFSEAQSGAAQGFSRFMVRYQSVFFFPLLLLEAFSLRAQTAQTLIGGHSRYPRTETTLTLVHYALFVGLLVGALGAMRAALFIVVHHALTGLYLGWAFAPNHIGMQILDADTPMGFLRRQVLTTRNVRPHAVSDFLYGGLNYQIEHHLFPSMPRNQLRRARAVVKRFCEAERIPYCETGIVRSYVDVLRRLHAVSAPLRAERAHAGGSLSAP